MMELFTLQGLWTFGQVMLINIGLSGDNAIVIGLAAAGLPTVQRNRVILFGIIAATVLRILLTIVAAQLLGIVGLLLAGGILLLWVCWKMWRDLRTPAHDYQDAEEALVNKDLDHDNKIAGGVKPQKTFAQAAWTIVVADVSMSLDNVIAVAGASRDHPFIMYTGLVASVLLMGFAASIIARLLQRYHWLGYLGLAVIFGVALQMVYHGSLEVFWPEEHAAESVPGELTAPAPEATPLPGAPEAPAAQAPAPATP